MNEQPAPTPMITVEWLEAAGFVRDPECRRRFVFNGGRDAFSFLRKWSERRGWFQESVIELMEPGAAARRDPFPRWRLRVLAASPTATPDEPPFDSRVPAEDVATVPALIEAVVRTAFDVACRRYGEEVRTRICRLLSPGDDVYSRPSYDAERCGVIVAP